MAPPKLTTKQLQFMGIVNMYAGIADTGNLMYELFWTRKQVVAVGRRLVDRGLVTFTPAELAGFEGGVWERK